MTKFIIITLSLMFLGGCGQKGPLYQEKAPTDNQTNIPSPVTGETNKEVS